MDEVSIPPGTCKQLCLECAVNKVLCHRIFIMKYYVVDAQSIVNFASVNHHAVLHLGKHRINFVSLLCQEHRWCYFCPLTTFDISFSAAFATCQVSFWLMVSVVDEYVDADITVMLLLNKSNSSRLLALRIRPSNMFLTNPLLSCISDVHNVRVLRILSKLMHCVRVCRHRPGIMLFLPEGLSRRNNPFRSTELCHTWIVDPQHPHQR